MNASPTYRIEFRQATAEGRPVSHTNAIWNCKHAGRPTAANLALYIEALEHSTCPGEINEKLGLTKIGGARIVRQATGTSVALYGILA